MKNPINRFLTVAVILLLIANIALVAFMLFNKEEKHTAKGGKAVFEKMAKEIGMTDAQKKEYTSLRESHYARIGPLFDTMRSLRRSLFGLMKDSVVNDSLVKLYSSKISTRQTEADTLTLKHFREIRKIFTDEQKIKYDDYIQKMMQRPRKDSSEKKK